MRVHTYAALTHHVQEWLQTPKSEQKRTLSNGFCYDRVYLNSGFIALIFKRADWL